MTPSGQDFIVVSKAKVDIPTNADGSYITDKIYYSAKNNEAYAITSGVIEDDYISRHSEYADKIISVSYDIITYDLIRELEQ